MTYIPLKRDSTTNAALTIDYQHHEIHDGDHFFIEQVVDISINNVYDIQWTTPNTTKWEHFVLELNCSAETLWYIYEGATILTAGTAKPTFNNNRNSIKTSTATLAVIANTTLANANLDTAVAGATEIAHGITGAGRTGGNTIRDREIILKQNTIYCIRFIATAAGYVNYFMSWYEHTNV